MRVLCYKCNHPWNYRGKNSEGKGYITCPGCLYKIRVDKALVEEPFKQELLTTKSELPKQRLPKLPLRLLTTNQIKPLQIIVPIEKEIVDQDQEEDLEGEIQIREIKSNLKIRIIPRDLLELVEHQRSFF